MCVLNRSALDCYDCFFCLFVSVFWVLFPTTLSPSSRWFPHLKRLFDIAGEHLLVMGGAVVRALGTVTDSIGADRRWRGEPSQDVDMFIVGLTEEDSVKLLEQLMAALSEKKEPINEEEKAERRRRSRSPPRRGGEEERAPIFVRSGFQVSCCDDNDETVYQFILVRAPDFATVLRLADIQITAIGFNPTTGLIATRSAAFCLGAGIIVANPGVMSSSYESRLIKYYRRGFPVIFPSLVPAPSEGEFRIGRLVCHRIPPGHDMISPGPRPGSSGGLGRGNRLFGVGRGFGLWRLEHPGTEEDKIPEGAALAPSNVLVFELAEGLQVQDADESGYFGGRILDDGIYYNLRMAARNSVDHIILHGETVQALFSDPKAIIGGDEEDVGRVQQTLLAILGGDRASLRVTLLELLKFFSPEEEVIQLTSAMLKRDTKKKAEIVDAVAKRALKVFAEAEQKARGLRFVPPGQGCFIVKPISARDWYGPSHYLRPTYIGLPLDVSMTLAQCRAFHSGWKMIPRDVYRNLVGRYIIPAWTQHILSQATRGPSIDFQDADSESK